MAEKKVVKLEGLPLHQFIAKGGKPKDFKGTKGLNPKTVPGVKKSS
jgi:hypothetical protein